MGILLDRIGLALRTLRKRAHLTQHEVADRLELTQGWISKVERSKGFADVGIVDGYLEVTGSSLYDLLDVLYGQKPLPEEGRQQVLDAYRLGSLPEEVRESALEKIGSLGWELIQLTARREGSEES